MPVGFTPEELLSALTELSNEDQVVALEKFLEDNPIEQAADVASMALLTVRMGVDASWTVDLVERLERITDTVATYNAARFGDAPAAG
jgi:hypothetical protein